MPKLKLIKANSKIERSIIPLTNFYKQQETDLGNEELELVMLKNANTISSQKSLADEIGFSVGKINYVLKALVDKGFHEKVSLTKKFIIRKKAECQSD